MSTPSKQRSSGPKIDTRPDPGEMRRHISKLVVPDSCFEIRIVHAWIDAQTRAVVMAKNSHGVVSGYYKDVGISISDLDRVQDMSAYIVQNPIQEALFHRFNQNKLCSIDKNQSTGDEHIDWWWRIYLDMDSIRPTGISATRDELMPVLERQDYLFGHEPDIRNASIWGCSGNGGWAAINIIPLLRKDLHPDDPDSGWVHPDTLVAHLLSLLDSRYSTTTVKIDPTTKNASRIGCIAGTWKCKGKHSEERPWRQVTLDSPERIIVPVDLAAYCRANPLDEVASNGRPRARKGRIVVPATLVDSNGSPLASPVPPSGSPNDDVSDRQKRATTYLSAMAPAVSGQNGHGQTFDAACAVVKGFGLNPVDAYGPLSEWNQSCQPPWDDTDLRHKLQDADDKTDDKPRGYLYEGGTGGRQGDTNGFYYGDSCDGSAENRGSPAGESGGGIQKILWNPREMAANDLVVSQLNRFQGLYQKDYMLVEIVQESSQHERIKYLDVPAGTPMINAVDTHRLREILSSIVVYEQRVANQVRPKVIYTPHASVTGIHSRSVWPGVPRLIGVVEHPIIRPDGSITERPGYDQDTGMLWHGTPIDPVPDNPSLSDARMAAEILLDLVSEFEFEDNVSECVWLTGLLTIVGRHLVNGCVPLFYFDASTSGSGKSLLCDVISCIATGRQMTRTAYHHDTVEMDKRLVSTFLAGLRVTMLDNIEGEFGNAALDNALTARYYSGRLLGHSKMSPPLLVDTTFFATANNAIFCGDLFRRAITCRLVSSCERPDQERTQFKIKELEKHAIANRPRLLCQALTILRAYLQAGCPCGLPTNVYGDWTRMIRGAIKWTMGIDPWEHRVKSVQSDSKRSGNAALIEGLFDMLSIVGKDHMTTSEIVRELRNSAAPQLYQTMYDAVMEVWNCRNGQIPSASAIGNRLGRMNMTRYGDRRILKQENSHTKLAEWYLQQYDKESNDWLDLSPLGRKPVAGAAGAADRSAVPDLIDGKDGQFTY